VDKTGSRSCPMNNLDINSVKVLVPAASVILIQLNLNQTIKFMF
jgi:hypothetical protein